MCQDDGLERCVKVCVRNHSLVCVKMPDGPACAYGNMYGAYCEMYGVYGEIHGVYGEMLYGALPHYSGALACVCD